MLKLNALPLAFPNLFLLPILGTDMIQYPEKS